jgi:hypothetical protein
MWIPHLVEFLLYQEGSKASSLCENEDQGWVLLCNMFAMSIVLRLETTVTLYLFSLSSLEGLRDEGRLVDECQIQGSLPTPR